MHHFLVTLLHFASIYALEVIYLYCMHRLGIMSNSATISLPNSTFSDTMLPEWNQPWWDYLHHRNKQMLQIRASFFLTELVVKHLPMHRWPSPYLFLPAVAGPVPPLHLTPTSFLSPLICSHHATSAPWLVYTFRFQFSCSLLHSLPSFLS